MKKNYIISGTALATSLAAVTFLRDVFDFKITLNDVVGWFQNPILQCLLAIILFCTGVLIGLKLQSRHKDIEKIQVFDLSDPVEADSFQKELYRSYQLAESEIYLTGTGFVSWSELQEKLISNTLKVTEQALERGINFIRIQMSDYPAEEWANKFANLMQDYSGQLKVYADYNSVELANVAIIDPGGKCPIVQLLFETEEVSIDTKRLDASVALFIYGRRDLARNLQSRFLNRIQNLDRLLPSEMCDLGLGIYYFAYSSNISSAQMKRRCPTARVIGTGILYGWELDFAVEAPHLQGNASGIYRAENEYVWGIVYAISKSDKEELDKIEQGGYYPLGVNIKMKNSQQHLNNVVAYIPSKPKSISKVEPDRHYIEIVLEGAKEHDLKELVSYLEEIKQTT